MPRQNHPAITTALLVPIPAAMILAAVIIVPLPMAAGCVQAGRSECCCRGHANKAKESASHSRQSCHQTAGLATCTSASCGCHRTPEPQNLPPKPTTFQMPTWAVAFLPTDAVQFHGGVEFAAAFAAAPGNQLTAIPHRILHCSWLI